MASAIIVTINLQGNLSGPVEHTTKQKNIVKLDEKKYESRVILHTDRKPSPCYRVLKVSEHVVHGWVSGDCPSWADPRRWKNMSSGQRIISYIAGFDEGHGVTFEYIN